MAVTQIADIYEPLTFAAIIDERAVELNRFIQSGVLAENATLTGMASQGGRIGEVPNFKPLEDVEPNISGDDPAVTSTPQKITGQKQIWRLAALNQSWSTMDLSIELALKDPAMAITEKVAQYWATQQQKRLVASALGVLNSNLAGDDDMSVVLGTDDVGAPTDAELVSAEAVINTQQTSGDHQFLFTAIAMHSVIFTRLKINNLIDYIPDSRGEVLIPTYLNMRVVVDDGMPAVAGTNRVLYTTVLFGAGAFGGGKGQVVNPSELDRTPDAGNGGGQETLYSRTSDIIHPWGCSFNSSSVADESATLAELQDAANWDRIYDRKNVAIAFLQTNG